MDKFLAEIGKRLLARRKQLGLTQEELAERADTTTQTVSTAENGRKALRPENIIKLCSALNISEVYLLRGEIDDADIAILAEKVAKLTPTQYRHLENIIENYIAAVTQDEK